MLKGKNLYYVLGLGAVAYYFFYMNKKKKAMSAPSTAPANFTGDLGVFDYTNAYGQEPVPQSTRQERFRRANQNVPSWATAGPKR
jgi:hypothetical protein